MLFLSPEKVKVAGIKERLGQACISCLEVNMFKQEEVSEHLMTERLESNEERLEIAEDKYQWAIAGLKLMSVEQKLLVLEAMELQMSSEKWRKFQEERYLSILEEFMDQRRVAR